MFCVKIFAVAGVLLLALGTAESQYKNARGFLEQEEKMDYKDMIIKKLLMKLNDVLRDRRQGESVQSPATRSGIPQNSQLSQQQLLPPIPSHLPAKTLIPQGIPQHPHIQQLPASQIQIPPPCMQQLPPPHIQQLPPPQIHQIPQLQPQQVRSGLKPAQPFGRSVDQQPQHFQPPNGCQYEYEEIPCPCGARFEDCPCCQEVQYEEVPCPCCEQQQQYNEDPFGSVIPGGNRQSPAGSPHLLQTGPIFTETIVSSSETDRTESESPQTEQSCKCCMSQGPITHLPSQRCSHCTQQPQMKSQPQQQSSQQVLMVPGRSPVQTMVPHTLHPSFFTGFTPEDQNSEERIVQKTPFLHPKLNELLHASHSDTC